MNEPYLPLEQAFVLTAQPLYESLVQNTSWDTRIRARKTASVGMAYNYSGMTYPDTEIPILLETRLNFRPNNCLLNYYESGDDTMAQWGFIQTRLMP